MKKVIVRSVFDAFDYVMQHYYPAGMEDMVEMADTYAVISIQDSHTEGFGITFSKNKYCKDVLTLKFDDIVRPVEGAQIFTDDMAEQIIRFIHINQDADTLLIHCYAGQSRSRAVGAFAVWYLGGDNEQYFKKFNPNMYVYDKLMEVVEHFDGALSEDDEYICESIFEQILTDDELEKIVYTGNEFSQACDNLNHFCQAVPVDGCWSTYLGVAAELEYLYGSMLSIMEDDITEEKKKRLAVLAYEIDRIVN